MFEIIVVFELFTILLLLGIKRPITVHGSKYIADGCGMGYLATVDKDHCIHVKVIKEKEEEKC